MTDLQTVLDVVAKILTALLPIIGLLKGAGIGQTIRAKSKISPEKALDLKSLILTRRPERKNVWRMLRWVSIVFSGLALFYIGVLVFLLTKNKIDLAHFTTLAIFLVIIASIAIWLLLDELVFTSRRLQSGVGSRVAREANLSLSRKVSYTHLMSHILVALTNLGSDLIEVNYGTGFVGAQKGANKIDVQVTRRGRNRYDIKIVSDATLPTVRLDFGANERNVSNFIRELLVL